MSEKSLDKSSLRDQVAIGITTSKSAKAKEPPWGLGTEKAGRTAPVATLPSLNKVVASLLFFQPPQTPTTTPQKSPPVAVSP